MTNEDAESVREVNAASVATLRKVYRPSQAALTRKSKRKKLRTSLVCVSQGKIVATVDYEKDDDTLHVMGPMVLPAYRRKGIARFIMDHLAEIAMQSGKRALSLNTIKQTGNVEIFTKLGFCPHRESPSEWTESVSGEDLVDVYMERELG
jgi:predicted GNAT family acetyltransferase